MPNVIDIAQKPSNDAFLKALNAAQTGDKIVYHRGEHAGGAHKVAAFRAAGRGLVSLVQKRVAPRTFEYIAQVRKGG